MSKGITSSKTPGYVKFDPYQHVPHNEAVKLRTRTAFKNNLQFLTKVHNELQEFCDECPTLQPSETRVKIIVPETKRIKSITVAEKASYNYPYSMDSKDNHLLKRAKATHAHTAEPSTSEIHRNHSQSYRQNSELVQVGEVVRVPQKRHPRRVPHNEIDNLMTFFTNHHVCHEIAINKCYRLQPFGGNVWTSGIKNKSKNKTTSRQLQLSNSNSQIQSQSQNQYQSQFQLGQSQSETQSQLSITMSTSTSKSMGFFGFDYQGEAITQVSRTFWSLLKQEMKRNEDKSRRFRSLSSFLVTFELVGQLKTQLLSVLMPHNYTIREELHRFLDKNLAELKEAAELDASEVEVDYGTYKDYALDVLSQVCCPSRDPEISALRKEKDIIKSFGGIFELIFKMKTDMNNFFLNLFRPSIMKNCIENERRKFADYLELEYRLHEDGLRATRSWLLKHRLGVRDTVTVIAKAYGEILFWSRKDELWPETLLEDIERYEGMKKSLIRIGILGGVILEIGKVCHKIFKNPPPRLRQTVSKYIKLLVPTNEEALAPENLGKTLEPVAEKSIAALQTIINKYLKRAMTANEKSQVYNSILKVADPENSFRKLMIKRIIDYAEEVIISAREYHVTVPSTLTSVMFEVAILVSEFNRIVLHNRSCFEEVYKDIVEGRNTIPLYPEDNDMKWDIGLLQSIQKLRMPIATPEEAREMEMQDLLHNQKMELKGDDQAAAADSYLNMNFPGQSQSHRGRTQHGGDNDSGKNSSGNGNNHSGSGKKNTLIHNNVTGANLEISNSEMEAKGSFTSSSRESNSTKMEAEMDYNAKATSGIAQRKFNENLVHAMKTVAALNLNSNWNLGKGESTMTTGLAGTAISRPLPLANSMGTGLESTKDIEKDRLKSRSKSKSSLQTDGEDLGGGLSAQERKQALETFEQEVNLFKRFCAECVTRNGCNQGYYNR